MQPQPCGCSNSVFAGFKVRMRPAPQLTWTAGPGGKREEEKPCGDVKAIFPVQMWLQSWGHCQSLAPSRSAGASPKSLSRNWDRQGARLPTGTVVMLCPRERSLFPPRVSGFQSFVTKPHDWDMKGQTCQRHWLIQQCLPHPTRAKSYSKTDIKQPIRVKFHILTSNKLNS